MPLLFQDPTLPETNIAPENGWLEDEFVFGARPIFRGELLVSGKGNDFLLSFSINFPGELFFYCCLCLHFFWHFFSVCNVTLSMPRTWIHTFTVPNIGSGREGCGTSLLLWSSLGGCGVWNAQKFVSIRFGIRGALNHVLECIGSTPRAPGSQSQSWRFSSWDSRSPKNGSYVHVILVVTRRNPHPAS